MMPDDDESYPARELGPPNQNETLRVFGAFKKYSTRVYHELCLRYSRQTHF